MLAAFEQHHHHDLYMSNILQTFFSLCSLCGDLDFMLHPALHVQKATYYCADAVTVVFSRCFEPFCCWRAADLQDAMICSNTKINNE